MRTSLVDLHFVYVEWLYSCMNLPVPQISRLPKYSYFLVVMISVGLAPIISKYRFAYLRRKIRKEGRE